MPLTQGERKARAIRISHERRTQLLLSAGRKCFPTIHQIRRTESEGEAPWCRRRIADPLVPPWLVLDRENLGNAFVTSPESG